MKFQLWASTAVVVRNSEVLLFGGYQIYCANGNDNPFQPMSLFGAKLLFRGPLFRSLTVLCSVVVKGGGKRG